MALFNAPKDVKVDDFFKSIVPEQFSEMVKGKDLSVMKGKDFSLQFDVGGKKYCLLIKDGDKLQMVEGGVDKPMLCICMNEPDWRAAVTGQAGGVIDNFSDPGQMTSIDRYNTLLGTKGKLIVDLDNGKMKFSMIFNGESSPEGTMKLSTEDWVAVQKKETNGQNLFMSGKLSIDGDMMFLMGLNALL